MRCSATATSATNWGATIVVFDDVHGGLLALELPTGQNAGRTLTHWIVALHTAAFWGLPMKLFVCAMGLVVVGLSLTGVYLWLKRRRVLALADMLRHPARTSRRTTAG